MMQSEQKKQECTTQQQHSDIHQAALSSSSNQAAKSASHTFPKNGLVGLLPKTVAARFLLLDAYNTILRKHKACCKQPVLAFSKTGLVGLLPKTVAAKAIPSMMAAGVRGILLVTSPTAPMFSTVVREYGSTLIALSLSSCTPTVCKHRGAERRF